MRTPEVSYSCLEFPEVFKKVLVLILKNENKKIEVFTLTFSRHLLPIQKFLKKTVFAFSFLLYENTKRFPFLSQILRSI
jgi:hypothetical protein